MELIFHWLQSIASLNLIKDVLVLIPGFVLGAFSLYFAYQKIGNKILSTYSIVHGGSSENRISDITLINKKNKPVTIFSIQAVINNDLIVEVEIFKPAMILKPLESVHITTTPFSNLNIGSDIFKADYLLPNKVDIYLITESKKIKVDIINPPNLSALFDFSHFRKASKNTRTYNGKVYNDTVKYAIVYRYESKEHTAFVGRTGDISEDWGFKYNGVPESYMGSVEKVKEYLVEIGYDKLFGAMLVSDIEEI